MTTQSAVSQLVITVAGEMANGDLSDASQQALEDIGCAPEIAIELLVGLINEGASSKPDDTLISAYSFLLGHALEQVRYAVDRGSPDGIALADNLRQLLKDAADGEHVSPPIMWLILSLFANAKLEISDELRNLMQRMMEIDTEAHSEVEPGQWSNHLTQMIDDLEGDIFALHDFLNDTLTTIPEDMRADFLAATFYEDEQTLREATVGFLCSEWQSVRFKIAELLENAASEGLVSPEMLRRMIAMRNWIPAEQRHAIDKSIKACRQNSVECASWPSGTTERVLATAVDGSGGLSVLVMLSKASHHMVAGLFGKIGVGIRDSWVRYDLSGAELKEIEARFLADAPLQPTSLSYAADTIRYLLAMNTAAGTVSPFGLLNFAEAIGLDDIKPISMPVDQMVEDLLCHIPAKRRTPEAIDKVLSESGKWTGQYPMLETWFEDTEEVRKKLVKRMSKKKKIEWLLDEPLQQRRQYWAQLLAWTAFGMRHNNSNDLNWQSFTIIAYEILQDRSLHEIPLMQSIATATLDVHTSGTA